MPINVSYGNVGSFLGAATDAGMADEQRKQDEIAMRRAQLEQQAAQQWRDYQLRGRAQDLDLYKTMLELQDRADRDMFLADREDERSVANHEARQEEMAYRALLDAYNRDQDREHRVDLQSMRGDQAMERTNRRLEGQESLQDQRAAANLDRLERQYGFRSDLQSQRDAASADRVQQRIQAGFDMLGQRQGFSAEQQRQRLAQQRGMFDDRLGQQQGMFDVRMGQQRDLADQRLQAGFDLLGQRQGFAAEQQQQRLEAQRDLTGQRLHGQAWLQDLRAAQQSAMQQQGAQDRMDLTEYRYTLQQRANLENIANALSLLEQRRESGDITAGVYEEGRRRLEGMARSIRPSRLPRGGPIDEGGVPQNGHLGVGDRITPGIPDAVLESLRANPGIRLGSTPGTWVDTETGNTWRFNPRTGQADLVHNRSEDFRAYIDSAARQLPPGSPTNEVIARARALYDASLGVHRERGTSSYQPGPLPSAPPRPQEPSPRREPPPPLPPLEPPIARPRIPLPTSSSMPLPTRGAPPVSIDRMAADGLRDPSPMPVPSPPPREPVQVSHPGPPAEMIERRQRDPIPMELPPPPPGVPTGYQRGAAMRSDAPRPVASDGGEEVMRTIRYASQGGQRLVEQLIRNPNQLPPPPGEPVQVSHPGPPERRPQEQRPQDQRRPNAAPTQTTTALDRLINQAEETLAVVNRPDPRASRAGTGLPVGGVAGFRRNEPAPPAQRPESVELQSRIRMLRDLKKDVQFAHLLLADARFEDLPQADQVFVRQLQMRLRQLQMENDMGPPRPPQVNAEQRVPRSPRSDAIDTMPFEAFGLP